MKLKLFSSVLLFALAINCSAQTALDTDGLNNPNNIYLYSLKEYCKTLDPVKTKIVYVKKDHFIGGIWPKKIKNFEIKYLYTNEEYKNAIETNGNSIIVVGISPLALIKGKFYVAVIPFVTTYDNNGINLANGGSLSVNFNYEQKKRGLIYKSKTWSGI